MDDSLQRRGQALEDLFFQQRDKILLERIGAEIASKQAREALAHISGITNEKVLQSLVEQGIAPVTLVSLTMIPLIFVAWADGKIEEKERAAILNASNENGIQTDSAAFDLLNSWLRSKPGPELMDGWKLYTTSLRCTLDPTAYSQVCTSIMERTTEIAKSAGGVLGLGSISTSEKKVLDNLEKILAP
jgi:hypothetical protein